MDYTQDEIAEMIANQQATPRDTYAGRVMAQPPMPRPVRELREESRPMWDRIRSAMSAPSREQIQNYLEGRGVDPTMAASEAARIGDTTEGRMQRGAAIYAGAGPTALLAPVRGTVPASAFFRGAAPSSASYQTWASPGLSLAERWKLLNAARTPVVAGQRTMPLTPGTAAVATVAGAPLIPTAIGGGGGPSQAQAAGNPPIPQRPQRQAMPRRNAIESSPLPPIPQRPQREAAAPSGPSSRELYDAYNKDPDNMAAYWRAVEAQREGRAEGGAVERASRLAKAKGTPCHTGIINMAVGGRTDHLPMNVLSNSYVLPADIVSGLGEGNTLAGAKILDQMFHMGPFGTKIPAGGGSPRFPQHQRTATEQMEPPKYSAKGGTIRNDHEPVQIIAAGGEYVIPPEVVEKLGEGDMESGHEYLDNFVKFVRHETAKTLKTLPGPRKD